MNCKEMTFSLTPVIFFCSISNFFGKSQLKQEPIDDFSSRQLSYGTSGQNSLSEEEMTRNRLIEGVTNKNTKSGLKGKEFSLQRGNKILVLVAVRHCGPHARGNNCYL